MSLLIDKFNEKMSKIKDKSINKEAEFDVLYSTGFLSIDYLNGTVVHVKNDTREFSYNSCGIVDGSTNTIIGRSGSGKSTLLTQIAGAIAGPFIDQGMSCEIFIDDIEGSLPEPRKFYLLDMVKEKFKDHVKIRNEGINTQNVYQRIQAIRDSKIENEKEFKYDTGYYDLEGNKIFKFVPTLYLIDSLPMLLPKELLDEEELGGSMSASSIAKVNTQLLKKISQLCKEANIILFTINHILDDIQMGFIPKPAQISGLKPGERLPGGRSAIYLANNMFRVDDSKTLKADKDYGIDGSLVTLTIIKSRTNANKRSIPLIFDKSEGRFNPELSYFELLNEEGKIQGTGVGMYFKDLPEFKFSKKNFLEKIKTNEELHIAFLKELHALLITYLSDTKVVDASEDNLKKRTIDIFNSFNDPIPDAA